MGRASSLLCSKSTSVILVAAGIFLSAVFVFILSPIEGFAQTSINPSLDAALVDLGEVYGQPITSVEQAKAICNIEQYLGDCAEIGKRHDLFEADEIKSVDAVLLELKGKLIDDLKNCADETCLVGVANQLAKRLASTAPTVAKELDLTTKKVAEKNELVKAAKEVGVNFDDCRTMDPDTASVELLRACAKLAKHQGVQKQLSVDARQAAENQDTSLQLQESLRRGTYQCGDNTLDGCGNYCLNSGAGAEIPLVCREIAQKFFGSDGVKQLELAHSQVQQTAVDYLKKAENVVFVTLDGQKLTSPETIGRYMEEAGRTGNIEAVEKGMDFLVSKGFVNPEERDFALRMVQKIKDQGGRFDFDQCSKNPESCDQFIHEEDRGQFAAQDKVHRIIEAAIQKNGVPNAQLCGTPQYSEICHNATQAVLPQLRQLAAQSPETKLFVAEIESRFVDANRSFETRRNVENKFQGGEQLKIGDRTFSNFGELEAFCRGNSSVCLAETARQGFIDRDYASQKYEYSFEVQQGPFPGFVPPGQGGLPPGRTSGFTYPGTGFGLPSGISKEDALKKFENWLDNPQGEPPIPNQQFYPGDYRQDPRYPYQGQICPQFSPRPCSEGQYRVDSRDNQGCFIPGECVPIQGYVPRRQTACPQTVEPVCPAGQYSRFIRGLDGCYVGECVFGDQREKPIGQVCPALATVSDCPVGEEKYVTYSSQECGNYFGCRKSAQQQQIQYPYFFSAGYTANNEAEARSYCQSVKGHFAWDPNICLKLGVTTQCSDGRDNDGDGKVDYPSDTLCDGPEDDDEARDPSGDNVLPFPLPLPTPIPISQCSDGRDNDADGQIDYPVDTGCYGPADNDEGFPPTTGSCTQELINLLGSDCHQMYSDSSGNLVFCDGPMTKSAKRGDTATTSGCSQTGGPTIVPSGQREQVWNSLGLKSWIRTDADSARIEQLKQACANVSSSANIWSSNSGNSTSIDFGMPSAEKCRIAVTCSSSQYFDGASCVTTSTTACPSGQYWNGASCVTSTTNSGSCTQELINLLGSGCHDMGTGYFDGPMNRYVLPGTVAVKECTANYISGCTVGGSTTTCPSGQYWNGASCVATSPTDCPSGQYWNGSSCTSSTTSSQCSDGLDNDGDGAVDYPADTGCYSATDNDEIIPTSTNSSCPSFAHDMSGYCMLNNDTSRCAEYSNASTESGYTATTCQQRSSTTTTSPTNTTSSSCSSGQYWNGYSCVTSTSPTNTTGTTCPSGQWWDGYSCVNSTYTPPSNTTTTCSSGQYWDGYSCVNSTATAPTNTTPTCSSGQYWDSARSSCVGSCGSEQYWDVNTQSCISNSPSSPTNTTTTNCPSGQYWSGSSCVNTSSTDCPSGQYWNGTACATSTPPPSAMLIPQSCPGSHYWDGDSCAFGTKKNVLHFIAEVRTSLSGFVSWLGRLFTK